jgi:hypothetical protein
VKILFAALHFGYFKNLESTVEELAARGHHVHLAAERPESTWGGRGIVNRLAARHPNVTYGTAPARETDESSFLATKIRLGFDYLRYLEPPYEGMHGLRRRAEVRAPQGLVRLSRSYGLRFARIRRLTARALDGLDHALPASPAIEQFLDEQQPEVLLITPLIGLVASSQLDLLRSAQARGLPTGICVWSWDHLSSKALIRDLPTRIFVWNDVQKDEAVQMHRIPAERVTVTGAQCFDQWFNRQPSRSRPEFCRRAGLPDERPFVLWVCSSLLPGSPSEASFVMRWAGRLRQSRHTGVRNLGILVRPHPSREQEWDNVDWKGAGVAMLGGSPVDDESRADYFDSLHYSAAVAGINTSAHIEAGIVGRPVMSILLPEFHATQQATLHFRYLMTAGGGLLTTARSLEEHEEQLAEMLSGPPAGLIARQNDFVRLFVRPHGLSTPATPILVDSIERLAGEPRPASPRNAPRMAAAGLAALRHLARSRWRSLLLDSREIQARAGYDEKREATARALASKSAVREAKARRVAEQERLARRKASAKRRRQLTERFGALIGRQHGSR